MTNGYQTIDRRQKLCCACECGQEATLNHFIVVELSGRKSLVLPGCEARFRDEQAARAQLREIVTRQTRPMARLRHVHQVYRLQHFLTERSSRKTAWRTAVVYVLGQRLGLMLARLWR